MTLEKRFIQMDLDDFMEAYREVLNCEKAVSRLLSKTSGTYVLADNFSFVPEKLERVANILATKGAQVD